jgi:hypothetical protein
MMEETLQGGGRAIDRQSKLLAHDGDREINVLYAAQDAGYEVTAFEGFRVTSVCHLVIGGAVDVIEYWSGQPSLGETPEIMKVVTVMQMHARTSDIGSNVPDSDMASCQQADRASSGQGLCGPNATSTPYGGNKASKIAHAMYATARVVASEHAKTFHPSIMTPFLN